MEDLAVLFEGAKTVQEVNKIFRSASLSHHPDKNGDVNGFIKLKNQRDQAVAKLEGTDKTDRTRFVKFAAAHRHVLNAVCRSHRLDSKRLEAMAKFGKAEGVVSELAADLQVVQDKRNLVVAPGSASKRIKSLGSLVKPSCDSNVREGNSTAIVRIDRPNLALNQFVTDRLSLGDKPTRVGDKCRLLENLDGENQDQIYTIEEIRPYTFDCLIINDSTNERSLHGNFNIIGPVGWPVKPARHLFEEHIKRQLKENRESDMELYGRINGSALLYLCNVDDLRFYRKQRFNYGKLWTRVRDRVQEEGDKALRSGETKSTASHPKEESRKRICDGSDVVQRSSKRRK